MASDKLQLDSAGYRILNADGQLVLGDVDSPCDCGCDDVEDCLCEVMGPESYLIEVILSGCGGLLNIPCPWPDPAEDFDGAATGIGSINVANVDLEGGRCIFGGGSSCQDTDDVQARIELVNDPDLGCLWVLTVTWADRLGLSGTAGTVYDLFTGYRLRTDGIVGAYTQSGGSCASATVS